MSEFLTNEEDLNEIINSMEAEDQPIEADVNLFSGLKVEKPFIQSKTSSVQPAVSFASVSEPSDVETTIIGSSTTIKSAITCGGNIEVNGHIVGKLTVTGNTDVYGIVEGDIEAGAIVIHEAAKITGNIICKADLRLEDGGSINGSIAAKNAYLGSCVQGDVETVNDLALAATASVLGDITAGNISVANGAVINGRIAIKRQ